MSRYVNPQGAPPFWCELAEVFDSLYSLGDADKSVTTLIDTPRIPLLLKKYGHRVVRNVVDEWYRMRGMLAHLAVEKLPDVPGKRIKEERVYLDVNGVKVGGKPDIIDRVWLPEWAIHDYKCTYPRAVADGLKPAWEAQVNVYRVMAELAHSITIPHQFISTIYADWTQYKAKSGEFPNVPCEDIQVERWENDHVLLYLEDRVRIHLEAEDQLPLCTDEDRWRDPDEWIVQNRETGRNWRVFSNEDAAHTAHNGMNHKTRAKNEVVMRRGRCKRCESFCPVADFCDQWQAEQQENNPVAGMTGVKGA